MPLPRAVDVVLSHRIVGPWRRHACAGVSGTVVEFGFGSGLNLGHYGDDVREVLAVEPDDGAWAAALDSGRITAFGRPVTRVGLDAAGIDLADASADAVVSTWTLCSIPDLAGALAQARRLLRPGGALHLAEHSLSPSARVARVQRAIQPAWGRAAGGCHIDRDIAGELGRAGFDTSALVARHITRALPLRPWTWFVAGAAAPLGVADQRNIK